MASSQKEDTSMRRSIFLLLALSGLAACAPTDGAERSPPGFATSAGGPVQCFQPDRVINFTRGANPQQVNLRVLGGAVFQVSSAGCLDLGSTNAMAISPTIGIGDRLCVGDSARITVLNPSISQSPCAARVERSLTAAEIEALPANHRP